MSDHNVAQQLVAQSRIVCTASSSQRRAEFASRNAGLDIDCRVLSGGKRGEQNWNDRGKEPECDREFAPGPRILPTSHLHTFTSRCNTPGSN